MFAVNLDGGKAKVSNKWMFGVSPVDLLYLLEFYREFSVKERMKRFNIFWYRRAERELHLKLNLMVLRYLKKVKTVLIRQIFIGSLSKLNHFSYLNAHFFNSVI